MRNAGAMIAGPFVLKGQSSPERGGAPLSAPGSAQQTAAPAYPLKISANQRYLVDQNKTPYLLQGEAAWELIVDERGGRGVEQYLRNRNEKGFNSVLMNLIEHRFSKKPPLNAAGEGPFTTPGDFTTPNEKYFAHADWVIHKAGEYGISRNDSQFRVSYIRPKPPRSTVRPLPMVSHANPTRGAKSL